MTTHSEFHARHAGLLDPNALRACEVLIVGCGSVGSEFARLLTRAGVRRFRLIDPDVVAVANLCRSSYLRGDVGRPKVDALAGQLGEITSDVDVETHFVGADEVRDADLAAMIEGASLVVAATDHPPTQARLGALGYPRRPCVFPGVYARGSGGEVLWTAPEQTPCYACVLGTFRGLRGPERPLTDYGSARGTLVAEPALGIDILHVTVCAARIAIALLVRESGSPLANVLDPTRTVLFVGNEAGWLFQEPFETVWARATRRDDCACRLRDGVSTASLFSEADLLELVQGAKVGT